MADLAEEVARFYGYDKIGTTLPTGEATTGKLSYKPVSYTHLAGSQTRRRGG